MVELNGYILVNQSSDIISSKYIDRGMLPLSLKWG
jgi:hypothetical protein